MSLTGLYLLLVLLAFTQVARTNSDADLDDDEFFGEAPPPQEQHQVRSATQQQQVKVEPRVQEKRQAQQHEAQDEFDEDEFHKEPAPAKKASKQAQANEQAKATQPPKDDLIARVRKWWVESVALTFFLVYCVNFWLGSSKNEKIVTRWGLLYKQLLLDNFAKVGSEAPITKLSQSNFSIIATGRTNCVGMHATFNLKNRQDLVSVLLGFLYPKKDRLTIDIALENDTQMMVFALLPLRYERTLKDDERFKDVREFAKRRKVHESVGLPSTYSVFSDSNEILEKMLESGLIGVLQQDERFFEFIHVSDQCTTSTKYKKLLRIELNLPEVEQMEELSNALQFSLALIDLVAHADLSPTSQAKAKRVRDIILKQQKKEEEKEELEKQQEAKAAKEEERLKNLSPEQKKKEEEKAKKKELKKKSKVMVKKYKM